MGAHFFHRANGLSVADASLVVSGITVVDGIGGTIVGGWIADLAGSVPIIARSTCSAAGARC